ncbi:hypothetical protein HGG72_08380 [Ochrobactrum pecoris]|uniref:Uncharacterized protein n=1 Tax=Brucella pecoris TaxID=867683 RepID=A0A5C5CSZ3_9HYPH|nr:hypothetical protein [Brucella pecoris]KAB2699343.1 hypothetical protein F9K79_09625 [Ochrobactrum sp. Kaboul]MBB4092444.1 hypothetical protein [Brucella pecoris]NKW80355.1 hypothetical protein [Brucella pecoris]TNV14287.1 hypothetical protein FIB18_03340 [Brucella pecoris]
MLSRPESVRRQADYAPFRHPHFETAKAAQRAAFLRELEESVRRSDAMRARLSTARVLESLQ